MDTRTFNVGTKMSLTVPATAVKALDVQPAGKGFVGHVLINAGALGQLRGRLDPRLLDGTTMDRDLDDATRWLVQPVFCGTDPVPLTALARVGPAGGDNGSSSPPAAPAGPSLDFK